MNRTSLANPGAALTSVSLETATRPGHAGADQDSAWAVMGNPAKVRAMVGEDGSGKAETEKLAFPLCLWHTTEGHNEQHIVGCKLIRYWV